MPRMVTMRRFRPRLGFFYGCRLALSGRGALIRPKNPASGRPAFSDLVQPMVQR